MEEERGHSAVHDGGVGSVDKAAPSIDPRTNTGTPRLDTPVRTPLRRRTGGRTGRRSVSTDRRPRKGDQLRFQKCGGRRDKLQRVGTRVPGNSVGHATVSYVLVRLEIRHSNGFQGGATRFEPRQGAGIGTHASMGSGSPRIHTVQGSPPKRHATWQCRWNKQEPAPVVHTIH